MHEYCDDHICCLGCRIASFCNEHRSEKQAREHQCLLCGYMSHCGDPEHYKRDGCPVCEVRDPNRI